MFGCTYTTDEENPARKGKGTTCFHEQSFIPAQLFDIGREGGGGWGCCTIPSHEKKGMESSSPLLPEMGLLVPLSFR